MSRFAICTVYLLCSCLNGEGERQSATLILNKLRYAWGRCANRGVGFQRTQIQASTPQRGLAAMYRSNVTWVHVEVCNVHGLPPLQLFERWGRETERPPYTGALHCTSKRRSSSRYARGIGTRSPPQRKMREGCLYAAPTNVHTARAAFCCWSTACCPHPARSADWLDGPCLAPAPCIPESNS